MDERTKLVATIAGQIYAADRAAFTAHALRGGDLENWDGVTDEDSMDLALDRAVSIVNLAEDHEERRA